MKSKILIVAAHPDDEILGCGGTVARFVNEGFEAHTLILGEGSTSRYEKRTRKNRAAAERRFKRESALANKVIGVKDVVLKDLPDNRFDAVPLLDIVKIIEKSKREIEPEIIFTHYRHDLNVDHRLTYEAVITAARPLPGECVKKIYSFEVVSSTEYNYPVNFCPDAFFDITGTVALKLKAFAEYKSEICRYPHPRSMKGIRLTAEAWGMRVGLNCAEAFKVVRTVE